MRYEVQRLVAAGLVLSGLVGCATGGDDGGSNDGMLPGGGGTVGFAAGAGGASVVAGAGGAGVPTGTAGVSGVAGGAAGSDAVAGAGPDAAGSNAVAGMGGAAGGDAVAGVGAAGSDAVAGMGGAAGSDVIAGAGGDAGGGGDVTNSSGGPPCMSDPRQVVVLGDSYVYWTTHTFPTDLAQAAGNGAAGVWDVAYTLGGRNYAVGGFSMGSGGLGLIPPELDAAIAADPDIIAMVMDGGGNDILIPDASLIGSGDCKNSTADPPAAVCQTIVQKAMDAASKMMDNAADHGISDVIYFFYPNVPAPTTLGGTSPNTILNWAYPMAQALCDDAEERTGGKLRCHFIDLRPVFMGHSDWFAPGDIHENSTGSKAIADAVVQVMKDNCIAQPASSGCCTP